MSTSLRRTLFVRTGLCAGLVLLLAGLVLYWLFRSGLQRQVDQTLIDKANLLASTVEQTHWGVELDYTDLDMREFRAETGPGYLQLWLADGTALYRSPSLQTTDLPLVEVEPESPRFQNSVLPDHRPGRLAILSFVPRREDSLPQAATDSTAVASKLTLVLARDTSDTKAQLAAFRLALLAVGLASLLVVTGAIAWAIRSGLKPIARLAASIHHLSPNDLASRLTTDRVPAEFRPVVDRLNQLLARLEAAFLREKTMSADLAHELRTPLAGLRSIIEVTLSRPRTDEEYAAALTECVQSAEHLQHLVENLLSLARIEAGSFEIDPVPVALPSLLREVWKSFQAAAEERRLQVRWDLPEPGEIQTDRTLLAVAVNNIMDNAVNYADRDGELEFSARVTGQSAEIRAVNSGSELTQSEAETLCDRFRRGDRARSATCVHYGLGLSLVRSILEQLGGEMRIEAEAGGQFAVTLQFPRQGSDRRHVTTPNRGSRSA
ncbi:MAG: histidine kinase dimerization/phospho-acceptor domain-containing protein [bacterium]